MTDQHLHQALRALHEKIERTAGMDDTSRRRLERLTDAIEQKLEHACGTDHHLHLVELVRDDVAYFEASHPALVTVLNQIMTILSSGGA
jgi:hypothetical protein